MARPRKLSILYFSHDVDAGDHWKFRMLRDHYGAEKGWAMEGRFWALNGLIGAAENCRLDLRRAQIRIDTAKKLDLSLQDFDDFVTFCSDAEGADLLHNDDGLLWTDRCQEELEAVLKARGEDRDRKKDNKPKKGEFSDRIPPGKLSIPPGIHPENEVFRPESGKKTGFSRELGELGKLEGEGKTENSPPSQASPPQDEPKEKTSQLDALRKVNPGLTLTSKDEERLCRFIAAESWETIIAAYRLFWERKGKAFWIFLDDFGEWKKQIPKATAPAQATPIPALEEMRAEQERDRKLNPNWKRDAALAKRYNHLPLTPEEEALLAEADAPPNGEEASDAFPESSTAPPEPEINEDTF